METSEAALYLQYAQSLRKQADWAFEPSLSRLSSLPELAKQFDAFLFDGFGTLYNLETAHPLAIPAIKFLRSQGKTIRLVTNAASRPVATLQAHLHRMGFDFQTHEIISSGDLLRDWNHPPQFRSAALLGRSEAIPFLLQANLHISENPQEPCLVLTAAKPGDAKQMEFAQRILVGEKATLIVLNPDAWAPNLDGTKIPVSGIAAKHIQESTHCKVIHLGKPFPEIFQKALHSLNNPASKVIMIGDTLGTDILGARVAGIASALVMGGNSHRESERLNSQNLLQVAPDFLLDPSFSLDY